MNPNALLPAVLYVISAPYFWLSMGCTAFISMFVGAIVYDGNLSNLRKGLLTIGLYAFFVLQVDYTRLNNFFFTHPERYDITRYAGIMTVLFVTIFWLFGMFLGVTTSRLTRKYVRLTKKDKSD